MMVRVDNCCVVREVNSYHHLILTLLGTSWHHLWQLVVRVDIYQWYELTWVRVDICCVVREVNSYHHLILAWLGTSWHLMVVRVDITCGTSWYLLVVRVDMGTSWHGHELTWVRVAINPSSFQAWIYHCHPHPLQTANCCRDSRLVVDEDDSKWVKN